MLPIAHFVAREAARYPAGGARRPRSRAARPKRGRGLGARASALAAALTAGRRVRARGDERVSPQP